jgi:hypothetical protein
MEETCVIQKHDELINDAHYQDEIRTGDNEGRTWNLRADRSRHPASDLNLVHRLPIA